MVRDEGRLIELSVLSVPGTDDRVAEIWDLGPDGGELMHVHKSATGEIRVTVLEDGLDAAFVSRWSRRAEEELRDQRGRPSAQRIGHPSLKGRVRVPEPWFLMGIGR